VSGGKSPRFEETNESRQSTGDDCWQPLLPVEAKGKWYVTARLNEDCFAGYSCK
jgi:hypothetical protein